jgi:hypothetical protein
MYISNAYVMWQFCPYITKVERINLKGKHKLNIYTKSTKIDENKAITSFASILVHSIDAHIVFIFESILSDIQGELQAKGIDINICTFTNHDNFGVNMVWARYLKVILKDNYNTISSLNYIQQLACKNNKERLEEILAMSTLQCENDNFVKH